jgi:hypothetical protein
MTFEANERGLAPTSWAKNKIGSSQIIYLLIYLPNLNKFLTI